MLPCVDYQLMQIWEANSSAMLVFSNDHDFKDRNTFKDISFHSHSNKIEITTAPANPLDASDQSASSSSTFTTDLLIAADGA